ncbi:hypothetical protein BJD55_gp159 [Gordonia phage Yvonnetastic]|uniref:Uncharacterized protein n=1 Tax=Gordonia phage Yvonnetastic TaxID=1821566 RepID=A0A142K924_9CAUD|nr:hypothetical protein BJD55_gp159 [Gordonia phage Yvonnetastic]AMS02607.1 hypothetical protein SEA_YVONNETASTIC_63 [Gordonia phage Yvonnetastic]WKW86039.1 hypothetical protein SEA_JONJAMES_65 [Gordonia Phage JonJames]
MTVDIIGITPEELVSKTVEIIERDPAVHQ